MGNRARQFAQVFGHATADPVQDLTRRIVAALGLDHRSHEPIEIGMAAFTAKHRVVAKAPVATHPVVGSDFALPAEASFEDGPVAHLMV